jgi:PAS domain S-box-containing protein
MGLILGTDLKILSKFSEQNLSEGINNEIKELKGKRFFAAIYLTASILIAIVAWQLLINSQRQNLHSVLKTDIELIHSRLDSFLENHLNKLELFASKTNTSNEAYLNELNRLGFDLIIWIDETFKIKRVNSDSAYELINTELGLEAKDRLLLESVIKNNKKLITSNLNLYNPGKELNFFIPIKNKKEYIVASIKIKHLMNYIFSDFSNKLDIKVYIQGKLLYQNTRRNFDLDGNKSFYWRLEYDSIYEGSSLSISSNEVLDLIISPSEQLIKSLKLFSDKYFLIFGLILSLLSYFGIYYLLISKTCTKITNRLINKLKKQLKKQLDKNILLKNNLIQISRSAEKSIKSKEEQFKFHKSSAYKLMCEAIKSKKEQEDISKLIKKSSSRLLLALESAGIGTWSWDLNENKIIWDSFIHKIFEITPDKSIADYEKFLDRIVIEDRERVDSEIQNALQKNNKIESNFCIQCPDGARKHISLKARIVSGIDKSPIYLTGTVQDLSYDINNSLLLNKFFGLPIVMFCVADLSGNFKILNQAWADTLGYSIHELKKYPFMFFVHPDDREKTQMEYQLLMGENNYRCVNFKNCYRTKNGYYKELVWNAIKIKGDNLIYAIVWEAKQESRRRYSPILQPINADSDS